MTDERIKTAALAVFIVASLAVLAVQLLVEVVTRGG
jgi:hypothetical protein